MTARGVSTLAIAGAGAGLLAWAVLDYQAWRALGPGGLPSTWRGWLTAMRLRLQKRDPLVLHSLEGKRYGPDDIETLADLPSRSGPRPLIGPHAVPQRQLTDHSPPTMRRVLADKFAARVAADAGGLEMVRSRFEKHSFAVCARAGLRRHAVACSACGEAGHIHPSDGSMHMILSPSDCCIVVARGWGELHCLAGQAFDLPPTYVLIYAPRDGAEVASVMGILDAAIAYMTRDPHKRPDA